MAWNPNQIVIGLDPVSGQIAMATYGETKELCAETKRRFIRIFSGSEAIADLPPRTATPEEADFSLQRIRLRRSTAWQGFNWGREASVRFALPKHAP